MTCKSVLLAISFNMHTMGDVVDASVHPPRVPSVWYELSIWVCADGGMFGKQIKRGEELRIKKKFGRRQGFMSLFKQVCLSSTHVRFRVPEFPVTSVRARAQVAKLLCMIASSISQINIPTRDDARATSFTRVTNTVREWSAATPSFRSHTKRNQ